MVTIDYVKEMKLRAGDRIKVECHDDLKEDDKIYSEIGVVCFDDVVEPNKKNPIGTLVYHEIKREEFRKSRGLHWIGKIQKLESAA